jgi:O-antigen/teichoic acid export membrane protein
MLRKNVIANVIGRLWGVASAYLFIPFYLEYLGAEAYGLIGFYATLTGALAVADLGLTATLNREMARLSARSDSSRDKADLLRTFESVYLCTAIILVSIVWVLGPQIVDRWLKLEGLNRDDTIKALQLMGLAITFQLQSNLYIGGLTGLQKQTTTNVLQVCWSIARGAGAVLMLIYVSNSLTDFFWWQLICNVIYLIVARIVLWRIILLKSINAAFKWSVLGNTWRYAAGMTGMALISTILMQADKLMVSKLLPLEIFGYYMLGAVLAAIPRTIIGPLVTAVFPRFTELVEQGNRRKLTDLYYQVSISLAVVIVPIGITLALFSEEFIFAWTGNAVAAKQIGITACLLVIGEIMQAVAVLPYNLALAHGYTKLNIRLGLCTVIIVTPLLFWLIGKYGLVGAGLSWIIMNILTLPPYLYFIHRRFMPGELGKWLKTVVVRPLLTTLPLVILGRWLATDLSTRTGAILTIALLVFISTCVTAISFEEFRRLLRKLLLKTPAL